MLTNKQIAYLRLKQKEIIEVVGSLRVLSGGWRGESDWASLCHDVANSLEAGAFQIDRILLEGSAKDERQAD